MEFYKAKLGKNGLSSRCRECDERLYYSTPKQWAQILARSMRVCAKQRDHGAPELTAEVLQVMLEGGRCAISGIPFVFEKNNPLAPSVDRIDSRLGYTLENVRVVCQAINLGALHWGVEHVLPIWTAAAKLYELRTHAPEGSFIGDIPS